MIEYERIDLNEYDRTGEGGTAVSYTHRTEPWLAKWYNPGFEAERAREEFLTARTVFEAGIPTPEPRRLVTDGERFGAEYELIPGKRSFTRIISQEPGRLEEISVEFAAQARKLHSTPADTARMRSYKQAVRRFYLEKDMVPEDYKRQALAFIETVPEAPTCVHGDLQIGNIITDGKRTLWIDVGEFGYGVPEWDLGLMYMMYTNMDPQRADSLFHVSPETLREHRDIFMAAYLGTAAPVQSGAFIQKLLPYYVVKVPYVYDMAYHRALPAEAFEKLSAAGFGAPETK